MHPLAGDQSDCSAAWLKKSDINLLFIALGKMPCAEHLAIDTTHLNWFRHAEVALRKPAYMLKLFQDDITVC